METSSYAVLLHNLLTSIFVCADKSLFIFHNYKIPNLQRSYLVSSFLFDMETSSSAVLLRNLLTSIFVCADKSLFIFHNYKIPGLLRSYLVSSFLFFLSLLPSLFSLLQSHDHSSKSATDDNHSLSAGRATAVAGVADSGVSRALTQLLLLMNDIPVNSRKYEVVRSLAEKLIDENLLERSRVLREVNCAVLSVAFARSLSQLEAAMAEQGRSMNDAGGPKVEAAGEIDYSSVYSRARGLMKGVKYYGLAAWRYAKPRSEVSRSGSSAEKLAAELLWLAKKMAASGCAEDAVYKWASAVKLAWLALSTEPRLQGSLVKVSAFLIREAKEMGMDGEDGRASPPFEQQQHQIRKTKMKMLMAWLPLLCRANNGTDAPVLSMADRAELEKVLEEIISTLDAEEEQEMVLSLWLHHFTYCPSSDWPNLRNCYTQWCSASRARLMRDAQPSSLIHDL